jgi:hypothetical protein
VNEKKDRVTDALNATKAAVEEGIVPGMLDVPCSLCLIKQFIFEIYALRTCVWFASY